MVQGVKNKYLDPLTINVASISIIPISIFLIFFYFLGSNLLNENLKNFISFIIILILCNSFKIIFINYSRIKNQYKNFLYYYSYDKFCLLSSLIIFIFLKDFELFIYIYVILNIFFIVLYFLNFKKINFEFLKDKNLINTSSYRFLINIGENIISIHVLIFVLTSIGEFNLSASITLGLTIYSLMTIPLALLETFLGPIIAKIFKINHSLLFEKFINKNLINFAFFTFVLFYIIKIIIFEFYIIDHFFPKYTNYRIIIFSIGYLAFVTFIKLYFYWFFNSLNKAKIIFRNSSYLLISVFILFYFLKDDLRLFIYFYILSWLIFALYTVYTFNKIKPSRSFIKLALINLVVITDFTIFYFYFNYQIYSHLFILVFSIVFYFKHPHINDFIKELKIKNKLIYGFHLFFRILKLENILILISKTFSLNQSKILPQNLMYPNNDEIMIKRNKIFFIINRSDFTQWQIYADYPELHYEAFLETKRGGNVIDVGSNIGSFSLVAANHLNKKNSNYKVYSFEPFNEIYNKLLINININNYLKDNLVTEKIALSDKIGEKLFFEVIQNNLGANSLKTEITKNKDFNKFIYTETLDNYCSINKVNNISFIKIDVEGMEIEILNGSEKVIEEFNPNLFIEINEAQYLKKNLSIEPYLINFEKKGKKFYLENTKNRSFNEKSLLEILRKIELNKNNFNLFIS